MIPVRLLVKGERGPGRFPLPEIRLGSRNPLWRWSDVMAWCATCLGQPQADTEDAAFVAALNGALDVRRYSALLTQERERTLLARILRASLDRDHRSVP